MSLVVAKTIFYFYFLTHTVFTTPLWNWKISKNTKINLLRRIGTHGRIRTAVLAMFLHNISGLKIRRAMDDDCDPYDPVPIDVRLWSQFAPDEGLLVFLGYCFNKSKVATIKQPTPQLVNFYHRQSFVLSRLDPQMYEEWLTDNHPAQVITSSFEGAALSARYTGDEITYQIKQIFLTHH